MTAWTIEAVRVNGSRRPVQVKWRLEGTELAVATVGEVCDAIERGDSVSIRFPSVNGRGIPGPKVVLAVGSRLRTIRTEQHPAYRGRTLLELPRF